MVCENHKRKTIILDAINDVYARHGDGFDFKIGMCHLAVDLDILKFRDGRVITKESACFYPQSCGGHALYKLVFDRATDMLRRQGVDIARAA